MKKPCTHLHAPSGEKISYHKTTHDKSKCGLIFLGGFMSDMEGTKAIFLEKICHKLKIDYIRFDYRGHGISDRPFAECTISTWLEDSLLVLDELSEKPQILVGSSMGGWIMLLMALRRPDRLKGLIGIAPAPDFTEKLLWNLFSKDQQDELKRTGKLTQPSDYENPYTFTYDLILDGRQYLLMDDPLELPAPLRILQGMADTSVPWQYVYGLLEKVTNPDTTLTLIKDGDHRLARDADLQRLYQEVRLLADLPLPEYSEVSFTRY